MQTTTTVGLDIAKSVFQVHGVDADGNVVVRRQLKRRYVLVFFQKLPPCLVGIEACASSRANLGSSASALSRPMA
jgi:transposase